MNYPSPELIQKFIIAGEITLLRELIDWQEYIENVYPENIDNVFTKDEAKQIAEDSYVVIQDRLKNGEYNK